MNQFVEASSEMIGLWDQLFDIFYVQDQLQRAALSVCLILAEGSAKTSIKDRRRFYEIALASHREVQCLLDIIQAIELARKADTLGGGLYNLNRALKAEP